MRLGREAKGDELWDGVDRKERTRIAQAVMEGRVLADVEDARRGHAVARAALEREKGRGPRLWRCVIGAIGIAYLIVELDGLRGLRPYALPTFGAIWAFLMLSAEVFSLLTRPGRLERLQQAERLNRQFLEAHGIAVDEGDGEPAAARPRALRLIWLLDLAACIASVGAVGVLPENGPGTRADHWRSAGLGACAFAAGLAAAILAFRLRRGGLVNYRWSVAVAGLIGLAISLIVLFFAVVIFFSGW